jgi:hypothetical protein
MPTRVERSHRVNFDSVYADLKPQFAKIARRYAVEDHPFLTVNDLVQEGSLRLVELMAERPGLPELELKRLAIVSHENKCRDVRTFAFRKRRSTNTVALDSPVNAGSEETVAEFVSDGSWERWRQQLEEEERECLLSLIERMVLEEWLAPGPVTMEAMEQEHTVKQTAKALGHQVRGYKKVTDVRARHIAKGLGLTERKVARAMGNIRQVLGGVAL